MRYKPIHACSWKNSRSHFLRLVFLRCVLWLNDTSYTYTTKVSEGTNRNMPARNTLVRLLALYTNSESHNAQRHRQTDGHTDGRQNYTNSRSYCVAVRSAKNCWVGYTWKMGMWVGDIRGVCLYEIIHQGAASDVEPPIITFKYQHWTSHQCVMCPRRGGWRWVQISESSVRFWPRFS